MARGDTDNWHEEVVGRGLTSASHFVKQTMNVVQKAVDFLSTGAEKMPSSLSTPSPTTAVTEAHTVMDGMAANPGQISILNHGGAGFDNWAYNVLDDPGFKGNLSALTQGDLGIDDSMFGATNLIWKAGQSIIFQAAAAMDVQELGQLDAVESELKTAIADRQASREDAVEAREEKGADGWEAGDEDVPAEDSDAEFAGEEWEVGGVEEIGGVGVGIEVEVFIDAAAAF